MNKVFVLGRLGKDPGMRYTPNGSAVTEFSLAIDESYRDKNGDKVAKVEWVTVVMWNKLAEVAAEYLTKGKQVLIEGRLKTETWEDQEGAKHSRTKIQAEKMTMLGGGKNKGEAPAADADDGGDINPDDVPF